MCNITLFRLKDKRLGSWERENISISLKNKPYGSTTNLKKTGIFHYFLQFTQLHSFCTHLFHWRQTPTIVDKHTQLLNLLFVFLKRYIYTNKSVFKEYNFFIKNYTSHRFSIPAVAEGEICRASNQPKTDFVWATPQT